MSVNYNKDYYQLSRFVIINLILQLLTIIFNQLFQLETMDYGRRLCDIENNKATYLIHLKKLEEVKNGKSPLHKQFRKQKKQIQNLLEGTRKIHGHCVRNQMRKKQITSLQAQKRSYQSIHSIVRNQINRKIITVPHRPKPDNFYLKYDNMNLIKKILNVKSQFNFKKMSMHNLALVNTKKLVNRQVASLGNSIDQEQILHMVMSKKIKLSINHSLDQWIKIHMRFANKQNLGFCDENTSYFVMLSNGDKSKKSKEYMLDEILASEYIFKVSFIGATIYFVENINGKQITRLEISFTEDQLKNYNHEWTIKNVEDCKNQIIGAVSIKIITKVTN